MLQTVRYILKMTSLTTVIFQRDLMKSTLVTGITSLRSLNNLSFKTSDLYPDLTTFMSVSAFLRWQPESQVYSWIIWTIIIVQNWLREVREKEQANFSGNQSSSYQMRGTKIQPFLWTCPTNNNTSCSLLEDIDAQDSYQYV